MKQHGRKTYLMLGATGGAVVLFGLVCWFLLSKSASIAAFFGTIVRILMPFIYGAVIAYILSPLCSRIERFLRKRFPKAGGWPGALSIAGALLTALLIVILLLALVIPSVVQSVIQIVTVLPSQIREAAGWFHDLLEQYPQLQASWDEISSEIVSDFNAWLQTDLMTMVQNLISSLSVQLSGIAALVKNLFLGLLISVYFLGSRRMFARQAKMLAAGLLPRRAADALIEEVHYADRMFNGFLVGRIVDSVIVGLICFVFTLICGFDSAVLVSVVVGVTNIIPVFGPFLGAIPCALILLLENPLHCLMFLIFIVILQQIDGNIIGPRILGQTTGVSSFWVLFAVMLFGGLWGIVGMIVGVPLFAVIYDIVKKLVYHGLHRHGREELIGAGGHGGQRPEDRGAARDGQEAGLPEQ